MIVGEERETLSSSSRSVGFGAEMNSMFFRTVSDSMYQHKVAAVIRECVSNAVDSHVEAGKTDTPIRVTLPNIFEPNLIIEDFGIGLSAEGVEKTFATYFGSDKRRSNKAIGGYGLGSKSPFSISDTFTIRARKDGQEVVYFASIASDTPELIPTSTRATDEPNGVSVKIPIRERDFPRVQKEARFILSFFSVPFEVVGIDHDFEYRVPNVQEQLAEKGYVTFNANTGSSMYDGHPYYVLMGGVCYPIPSYIIERCDPLISHMTRHGESIAFPFEIGSLQPAPSRENLSLDEDTEKFLIDTLDGFVKSFNKETIVEIDAAESIFAAIEAVKGRYPAFQPEVQRSFRYKGKTLYQWSQKYVFPPIPGMRKYRPDWHGGGLICRKNNSLRTVSDVSAAAIRAKKQNTEAFVAFYRDPDDPHTGFMSKIKNMVRFENPGENAVVNRRPFFIFLDPMSKQKRDRVSRLYGDSIKWVGWKEIKHLFKKGPSGIEYDRGTRTDRTVYAKYWKKGDLKRAQNIDLNEMGDHVYHCHQDSFDMYLHRRMEGFAGIRNQTVVVFSHSKNIRKLDEAGVKPVSDFYSEVKAKNFDKMALRWLENQVSDGARALLRARHRELGEFSDRAQKIMDEFLEEYRKQCKPFVDQSDSKSRNLWNSVPVIEEEVVSTHPLVVSFNEMVAQLEQEYSLYFELASYARNSVVKRIVELIDMEIGLRSNGQDVGDVECEESQTGEEEE